MEIADPRIDPSLIPPGSIAKVINGPHHEFIDLPAVITPSRHVITRWSPTEEERRRILDGADIYVTLVGVPINPLYVTVGPIDWTRVS